MQLIETHAHIYLKDFKNDIDEAIERSEENSVERILMPNIDHSSIDDMLELEQKFPDKCSPMMGLHPCSVKKNFEKELYIVEEWLSKRKFVAVGETGIDLYWDKTFFSYQKEAFKVQIGLAKKYKIPIVIHCRDSFTETISIVEEHLDSNLKGVFHCFTGTLEEAKRAIAIGFYLGIGGVATFKNGGLDKVIPGVEKENILLETDSPYLAPVPHRGKRNEPSFLKIIAEKIAAYKNISIDEVAEFTTENARRLFALDNEI